MARAKKLYDGGDLVEVVKTSVGTNGSLDQVKPVKSAIWNVTVPRKTRLFVIRHESGGGTDRFVGSVLCMWASGIIWMDARNVALVIDKDGRT